MKCSKGLALNPNLAGKYRLPTPFDIFPGMSDAQLVQFGANNVLARIIQAVPAGKKLGDMRHRARIVEGIARRLLKQAQALWHPKIIRGDDA
jgi:hypothetical protein